MATFDEGGLVFSYPASWRIFRYQEDTSFSHLIAYLATVMVEPPCATRGVSGGIGSDCTNNYQLAPDTIVVTLESRGMPGFSILNVPEGATPLTVGGLPAWVGPTSSTGTTRTAFWSLARPGSVDNSYGITATIQGPGFDELQAQLEAALASLRYDPPLIQLPSDQGAASNAAIKALGILVAQDSAWGCFPAPGGSREMTLKALPMGPALARPQLAACSTAIEATPLQLWRMTVTLRLAAADPAAGAGEIFTVWVNPDGTPGQTEGGPLPPAS